MKAVICLLLFAVGFVLAEPYNGYDTYNGYGGGKQNYFNTRNYGVKNQRCLKMNNKKVKPYYYNKFKYRRDSLYKAHKVACDEASPKEDNKKNARCPLFKMGFPFRYSQCTIQECQVYNTFGFHKCHGRVQLVLKHDYPGRQCRLRYQSCTEKVIDDKGFGKGYGYSPKPGYQTKGSYKCMCETVTCSKKIKACYEKNGYHYEDFVDVEIPCGCQCFKRSVY